MGKTGIRIRLTKTLPINKDFDAREGVIFEVIRVDVNKPRGAWCKGKNGKEFKALEGEYETVQY